MAFSLDQRWVWDFWLADDGERYHLYYLWALKSLGDPELRHRNAQIGHATSSDLVAWQDHGGVISPGPAGAFDESATWTGCVVRGEDRMWRMYYTGVRFASANSVENVESVGMATSSDLHVWEKRPDAISRADPRWYETLGTSSWTDEAWRDPWVFPDPAGDGWHMLLTARANHGDDAGRGVVGHARSHDLDHWQAQPPLSTPQAGFAHLEVPQLFAWGKRQLFVFSCESRRLTNRLKGQTGGIWVVPAASAAGPYAVEKARRLAPESLYAGRLVRERNGRVVLLAFGGGGGDFSGAICDPIPVTWDARRTNRAVVRTEEEFQ